MNNFNRKQSRLGIIKIRIPSIQISQEKHQFDSKSSSSQTKLLRVFQNKYKLDEMEYSQDKEILVIFNQSDIVEIEIELEGGNIFRFEIYYSEIADAFTGEQIDLKKEIIGNSKVISVHLIIEINWLNEENGNCNKYKEREMKNAINVNHEPPFEFKSNVTNSKFKSNSKRDSERRFSRSERSRGTITSNKISKKIEFNYENEEDLKFPKNLKNSPSFNKFQEQENEIIQRNYDYHASNSKLESDSMQRRPFTIIENYEKKNLSLKERMTAQLEALENEDKGLISHSAQIFQKTADYLLDREDSCEVHPKNNKKISFDSQSNFPIDQLQQQLQILHSNFKSISIMKSQFNDEKMKFENQKCELSEALNKVKNLEEKVNSLNKSIFALEEKNENLKIKIIELGSQGQRESEHKISAILVSTEERLKEKELRIIQLEQSLNESETSNFRLTEQLAIAYENQKKSKKNCQCKTLYSDLAQIKDYLSNPKISNTESENQHFSNEVAHEIFNGIQNAILILIHENENIKKRYEESLNSKCLEKGYESCSNDRPVCPEPNELVYENIKFPDSSSKKLIKRSNSKEEGESKKFKIEESDVSGKSTPKPIRQIKRKSSPFKMIPTTSDCSDVDIISPIDDFISLQYPNIPFLKMSHGVYEFFGKKFNLKLINGKILARVGGGYIPFRELVDSLKPANQKSLSNSLN